MAEPVRELDQLHLLRAGLAGLAEAGPDALGELPEDVRHELLRQAVLAYSAAWQDRRASALADGEDITATDAVVAASGLLRAVNVEVFELAMWQTRTGG